MADPVVEIAKDLGATPAQVALAWLLAREIPLEAIPGTRRIECLDENWAALDLTLPAEQLRQLDSLIEEGVRGERY